MPQVRMGSAMGAGFRLIGREPLAFFVWCLVFLLVGALPQVWVMFQIFPMIGDLAQRTRELGGHGDAAKEALRIQSRVMGLQPIVWLSSLVAASVLCGAIFRAVLTPDDRAAFYLRLSRREGWLALNLVVLYVLFVVACIAVFVPAGIAVAVIALTKVPAFGPLALTVAGLTIGVLTWLVLRMSMAPLMSFEAASFMLTESWSLTRGHSLRLFLVGLALGALICLLELGSVLGVVGAFASALSPLPQAPESWASNPMIAIKALGPGLAVGFLIAISVFGVFATTLFVAAWAESYRQLKGEPA